MAKKPSSLLEHVKQTFSLIGKNFKLFAGLVLVATVLDLVLVGLSEEAAVAFGVIVALMVWLVAIFCARHLLEKRKVSLRDGLYNATTPLMATLVVLVVAVIQCVPIFLLVIAYASAIETDFLSTPFYALLFWGFAALMVLISGYLLPGTVTALTAVSVPGLYPLEALKLASALMVGRRVRFMVRLVAMVLMMGAIWAVVMLPVAAFDGWLKTLGAEVPVAQVFAVMLMVFTVEYAAVYLYIYYRWMINYDKK